MCKVPVEMDAFHRFIAEVKAIGTTIINKSAPMKETGNNSTTGHRLSCVVCRQTIPSAQTNDNRSSVSAFISIQSMLYSRCDTCHGQSVRSMNVTSVSIIVKTNYGLCATTLYISETIGVTW